MNTNETKQTFINGEIIRHKVRQLVVDELPSDLDPNYYVNILVGAITFATLDLLDECIRSKPGTTESDRLLFFKDSIDYAIDVWIKDHSK